MAKENDSRSAANVAPALSNEEAQIDDNKENEGADNKNFWETENQDIKSDIKSDMKSELKPELKSEVRSEVPPSADIDKVTADLVQSRTDLLGRVHNLKKDLQDWRGKLDSQVKTYRQELGELRSTLNTEVEQLRNEFQALRTTLKKQLDATSGLAELGPSILPEKVIA